MNLNNECCCGCNTQLADLTKINNCPACNNEGISVGKITVEHLVTDEYRESVAGDRYRICMNDSCDVIYYDTDKGVKFVKDQVRVPIWFSYPASDGPIINHVSFLKLSKKRAFWAQSLQS